MKKEPEKLNIIRESVDYLTLRINVNADICRYLDRMNTVDSVRVFEKPSIKFVHDAEILGKLHVLRILDIVGNSIGSVQFARKGAIGFFSELHLKGNFWFIYPDKLLEMLILFEKSMNDDKGIVSIDYSIDVSEWVEEVQNLFSKISWTKGKLQPLGSAFDTWQSINTRRLKTKYYDKKLDILQKKDTATGKKKYDLCDEYGSYVYRDYYENFPVITRIEQTRKWEALREQNHSLNWYLRENGIRSLTLEDLKKKGIEFENTERQRIRYEKRDSSWKEYSDTVLQERKEYSKKMFQAYAKSLARFGLLENELQNMGEFLEIWDLVSVMDKTIKKEMDKVFF